MGGGSPSPPPAPDPWAVAAAQGRANVGSAISESILNNTNQVTPYGNINYKETGGKNVDILGQPIWIPQYTATTQLSPEMQTLFNQNLANSQQASNTAGALGKNVAATLSNNVDLGPNATAAYLDKLNTQTLDPQFAQAQTALNQQLADQGLTPGSEGWKYAQTQFGLNKANTYNNMYLQGQNTAVQDILAQYNEPLNALSALQSGSQVGQPGIGTLAPAAQESIQPPPIAQMIQSNYANQTQQYDAQVAAHAQEMGGLFGLGGQAIGAVGGLLSDRKDKKDIEKLGEKDGFGIYAYRYKSDKPGSVKTVGPMAQEVEKKLPGSTFGIGGHRVIKIAA
jgi:hypothetical protein